LQFEASPSKKHQTPSEKQTKAKRAGGAAEMLMLAQQSQDAGFKFPVSHTKKH
jgi:hypothetical protein